jgi:hypothetical protein
MKKINDGIERNRSLGESDIYRKFSEQFDKLFDAGEIAKDDIEFEKLYIHDNDFEEQINRFKASESDVVKFCVGYTGIGKTTGIRHCFGLGISNQACFDTVNKTIVFPTFLDGYQVKDMQKFDLPARIAAVCTGLKNKHPELGQLLKTYEGKKEFYEFVLKHTSFALENIDPIDSIDMEENELIKEKLKGAYNNKPFEYQANLLKFYIMKKYDCYNQLIIVLDDIESLPENDQKDTIAMYLKLHSCLRNTEYPFNSKYNIKMLISVRPHTHRIVHKSRQVETFFISEPEILKKRAVDLDSLFQNRFDYYTKQSGSVIGNIDTWKKCYEAVQSMNGSFEGKYKDMISNLCFMNIRVALASYSRIFANRFWIQKNKNKEDRFSINIPDYTFKNTNVIRALACNEEAMYWGDINCIMPNIFYTTQEDDLSVHSILLMRYFEIKRNNEEYGLNAETIDNIKMEWKNIFGEELYEKFLTVLEFLFERKILRKSIKDKDDEKSLEVITNGSRLYISPRGKEMYEMLSRDSVLLEMIRENAWRDYDGWNYSDKGSSDLMREGKQKTIFIDLLEYIDFLSEQESEILSEVSLRYKKNEYKNLFGRTPVVKRLLCGVENSLNYSGIMQDMQINTIFHELESNINRMMQRV